MLRFRGLFLHKLSNSFTTPLASRSLFEVALEAALSATAPWIVPPNKKSRNCSLTRQHHQWYTTELSTMKRSCRAAERRWRKTRSICDKDICRGLARLYGKAIVRAKQAFYGRRLLTAASPTSEAFKIMTTIT